MKASRRRRGGLSRVADVVRDANPDPWEILNEIVSKLPWHERGFPKWALEDTRESDAKFIIARYSARRLLLSLVAELRVERVRREKAETALRGLMDCVGYLPTVKRAERMQKAWDVARAVLAGEGDEQQ